MNFEEEKLKSLWQENQTVSNEDDALKKVLSTSANVTAAKDVSSLFVGWVWVVFLGFGASIYSAKRKFDLHQQDLKTNTKRLVKIKKNNQGKSL